MPAITHKYNVIISLIFRHWNWTLNSRNCVALDVRLGSLLKARWSRGICDGKHNSDAVNLNWEITMMLFSHYTSCTLLLCLSEFDNRQIEKHEFLLNYAYLYLIANIIIRDIGILVTAMVHSWAELSWDYVKSYISDNLSFCYYI